MGLFTDPVVLTDGVDATRNFSFRAQISDSKSVVGEWIEDSSAPLAAESKIVVKHDNSSTNPRHLVQRKINRSPAALNDASKLEPITINVTVNCSKNFTAAEVQTELNLTIDMCQEANFLANLLSGKI